MARHQSWSLWLTTIFGDCHIALVGAILIPLGDRYAKFGDEVAGYYVLKRSGDQFMFNLKAGNHEVILTSERYSSKQAAQDGIASAVNNSPVDARYERKTSTAGQPYFTLLAGNGKTLGRSEMYSSTSAMEKGIESCKSNGPIGTVKDET